MSTPNDGGPACAWCNAGAHIKQGRIMLCEKHYRFSSMRARAKRDGKITPSVEQLESILPSNMQCIGCGREMKWLRSEGASTQITLQHDRCGTVRFLCLGCNTRHSAMPGDIFYSIPDNHHFCQSCESIKPLSEFAKDRSRPLGHKGYCKTCCSIKHRKWRTSRTAADAMLAARGKQP